MARRQEQEGQDNENGGNDRNSPQNRSARALSSADAHVTTTPSSQHSRTMASSDTDTDL